MYKVLTYCDFYKAFKDNGRLHQFSDAALKALYNYLIEYKDSTDCKIQIDVVYLCCNYTNYKNVHELLECYDDAYDETLKPYLEDTDGDIDKAKQAEIEARLEEYIITKLDNGSYLVRDD